MNKLQHQAQKVLKENKVDLSRQELVLGIYDELSNLTRSAVTKEKISPESLGELGVLLLELCNEEGLDFEEVVEDYLKK